MFFSIQVSAQVPLTTTTNTLRHGDILCKVEVPYVEAGERGEEVVWQLGEITDDSRDHLQDCDVRNLMEYLKAGKNEVEVCEMRNELLFEIIQDDRVISLLSRTSSDSVLQNKIFFELQSPINDSIDLLKCKQNLKSHEKEYPFIVKWVEAIDIAIQKVSSYPKMSE